MDAKVYYNTIWVYTFLEHIFVFLCKVQVFGVYCKLSQTEKYSVNKEDFRLKWDFMWQKLFLKFLKQKFD